MRYDYIAIFVCIIIFVSYIFLFFPITNVWLSKDEIKARYCELNDYCIHRIDERQLCDRDYWLNYCGELNE